MVPSHGSPVNSMEDLASDQTDLRGSPAGPGLKLEGLHRPGFGPFDLALVPGECCVVSGPSGAGKTVFLRMIADLDPNEGAAWLGERRRESMPAPQWRRLVTYVAAESGWWGDNVGEHFEQASAFERWRPMLQLAQDVLTWPVARLSTGERQRLALLRAIIQSPPVLLLDEPTSALDPSSTGHVEDMLKQLLAEGVIIIVVSHQSEQAQRLASRQLHIDKGKFVAVRQ
jgi:putative ABC transport system ATP-binding protein